MIRNLALLVMCLCVLSACATNSTSNPARTAREQLLISTAADRAADKLTLNVPQGSKIFVDATNFEGTDSKYAVGAIRTSLFRQGAQVVDDKKNATVILELRSGTLSTDQDSFIIGIPTFNLPVPFASTPLAIPQIALYGTEDQQGIAKFGLTGYDVKSGALISAQPTQYGFSHNKKTTVLIFISWSSEDYLPQRALEEQNRDQNDNDANATNASPAAAPIKPRLEFPITQ